MAKKILLVEDETMLLRILVDKFTTEGFTVLTAENGAEGLTVALNNHPDLILLDIVMPVMDGLTMLSRLRKDPWGKDVKVILLTNLSDPGRVTETTIETVSGFIVKSDWRIEDLVKEVKNKLDILI